jgi:hypothetical protein
MCGSERTQLYLVRSFKYRNEKAIAEEVQRVIVYIMLNLDSGENNQQDATL